MKLQDKDTFTLPLSLMNIGGITPFTTIDYPGMLATTIYVQGCNFRCVYCHNYNLVKYEEKPLSFEYVRSFLESRRKVIDGVVICGGEPTIHPSLPLFCRWLKGMGFKVKLDTNGGNPQMLESLISSGLIDFVAMDIKAPWRKYLQITRVRFPLENIEKSIEIIKRSGIAHEFRTTVHSKLHTPEDIKAIAEIIGLEERLTLQVCKPTERFDVPNEYTVESLKDIAKRLGIKYRIA